MQELTGLAGNIVHMERPTRTATASITTWLSIVLLFIVGATAAFGLLMSVSGFAGNDDYYHVQMALQIAQQGKLRVDFPWLPDTLLSPEQFVDHHLLYHLYLAPWVYWGGAVGAKLAHALLIGALFACVGIFLRTIGVRHSVVWTVALLSVSTPFLYRSLMIRTQAPALLLLVITLYALYTERDSWLIPLAFGFSWLYNGFILLPAIVVLYTLAVGIADRRFLWRPVTFALLGMALGLIINPYFPNNLFFIVSHLGEKVDLANSVRVGNEWYPYTTEALMDNSLGSLLLLGAAFLAPSFRRSGRDKIETALLLVALLTLAMVLRSRRFIEYFPAFALLVGAAAWGRSTLDWRAYFPEQFQTRWLPRLVPLVLAVSVLGLGWHTVSSVQADLQDTQGNDYLAGAAQWLQANTEPNSLVFQTDWDDFPYLFYHNTHNTYLVGLDPTYLQMANPDLWNIWVAITQGDVEVPSVLIRDTFNARYVVSDTHHAAFAARADADPAMVVVYRDANSIVWQVKAAPTEE
ncbi:MAG: hypothetical protein KF716_00890 [Anaerolineae bacterium]|nr:hypothetical protein [Anaerolineae bacterium]